MKKSDSYKSLFIIIFILAALLRLSLALVNTKANDNHFEVIQIINNENRIPVKTDCWECHQPKFFHFTAAIFFKILAINSPESQRIFLQLLNSCAGVATIYIVYLFLKKIKIDERLRVISFALVAFNPRLIGINIQVTNDSYVILFSTLAIYFSFSFFKNQKRASFYLMLLFSVLAGLTKANGLVVFVAIGLAMLVRIITNRRLPSSRTIYLKCLTIFVFLYLAIVPFFGQYLGKYFRYGSPFSISYVETPRPGFTSFGDSYLTFRIINLMQQPVLYNLEFMSIDRIKDFSKYNGDFFPLHRTSLWTRIYARHYFLQFDDWPLKRMLPNVFILNLGRVLFSLALLPASVFLYGFFRGLFLLIKNIYKEKLNYFEANNDWIFFIFFSGFILFLVLLVYRYPDFSSMKIEYIYPGILCFVKIFADGLKKLYNDFSRLNRFFSAIFATLTLFYLLDISSLWFQLL